MRSEFSRVHNKSLLSDMWASIATNFHQSHFVPMVLGHLMPLGGLQLAAPADFEARQFGTLIVYVGAGRVSSQSVLLGG